MPSPFAVSRLAVELALLPREWVALCLHVLDLSERHHNAPAPNPRTARGNIGAIRASMRVWAIARPRHAPELQTGHGRGLCYCADRMREGPAEGAVFTLNVDLRSSCSSCSPAQPPASPVAPSVTSRALSTPTSSDTFVFRVKL